MGTAAAKTSSKEALLESARYLFSEKGYAAVSTREIAERAGVNLGAIQYYFGSKAQLFIETVNCLFAERSLRKKFDAIFAIERNAQTASYVLSLFILVFLDDLCNHQGPDGCRIMHREILDATSQDTEMSEALISSVVETFMRPVDEKLLSLVSLLRPHAGVLEKNAIVQSIIGQCSFYVTHRPFAQRLRDRDFTDTKNLVGVGCEIARFTLRGMGVSESEIDKSVARAKIEFKKFV